MQDQKQSREQTGIEQSNPFDFTAEDSIFAKYKFGIVGLNAPFKLVQTSCSTSGDDDSQDEDSEGDDKKVRGPYRKYTIEEKMKAVEKIANGQDVKAISKQFGIPRRNLLRWKKNGCQRKEGGGRPTDAQMERTIYQKIVSKQLQTQKQIRKFAIELSKTSSFKASKGWFVKFCNRFNISLKSSSSSSGLSENGQNKNQSMENNSFDNEVEVQI